MPVKPKPPVSAWIQSERKRMGWKVHDLSRRLIDLGYDAQESTVGVWEAGRSPKAETIEALERLFGSQAPREDGNGDMTALVAALSSQTAALNRLADRLEAQPTVDLVAAMKAATEATVVSLVAQGLLVVPSPPRQPRARQGSRS